MSLSTTELAGLLAAVCLLVIGASGTLGHIERYVGQPVIRGVQVAVALLSSLKIPVVYVTHDQHEATAIGDRLAVIEDGTFSQHDTPTEVFAHPATPFVASFTGSVNLFRARVAGTDSNLVLDWNDRRLEAPDYGHDVDEAVWFCIRPEFVTVAHNSADDDQNVLDGTVTRRGFEGNDYLIDIVPDGMDDVIQVTLPPPDYDRLGLTDNKRVRIFLKKEAIHVIGNKD